MGDGLFVQQLILAHGRLFTHPGRDVHLLDIAQGAEVVQDAIVGLETVADFLLVVLAQRRDHLFLVGPVQVIDDVGGHEVIHLLRSQSLQVPESRPERFPPLGGSRVFSINVGMAPTGQARRDVPLRNVNVVQGALRIALGASPRVA